ncbi:thiol-disulfide oxidoreductase DCC family protein [Massilia aerilata]|uniref:Thiol-disulfide oxidoreductase DCC family protein n=1 Tax=Massilia aerilata TaxID=453817 RepID=A0ABW0RVT8_9BURK
MSAALTLYFDGLCPFCAHSMRRLKTWDAAGRLAFVDIAAAGFDPSPLGVDMAALNREVHGLTREGEVLAGIDTMLAAYTLAGRGWLVWPLRVRLLRPALAASYRWFARHRYAISKRLGYRLPAACDGVSCAIGNPFLKR